MGILKGNGFVYVYSVIGKLLNFWISWLRNVQSLRICCFLLAKQWMHFPSSEALFQWLFEFCSTACNCLERSVESYHLQLCNDVKRYTGKLF